MVVRVIGGQCGQYNTEQVRSVCVCGWGGGGEGRGRGVGSYSALPMEGPLVKGRRGQGEG